MPKRFPTPPDDGPELQVLTPDEAANIHPRDGRSGWGLHPEIMTQATADDPDLDALGLLLARENMGGRATAELLVMVKPLHKQAEAKALSVPEAEEALRLATEKLDALKHYRATDMEEALARTTVLRQAETEWSRALNEAPACRRAAEIVQYLETSFPALFGIEPFFRDDEPKVCGTCPPEIIEWHRKYGADANVFNDWRKIQSRRDPSPRPVVRLRVAGGPTL